MKIKHGSIFVLATLFGSNLNAAEIRGTVDSNGTGLINLVGEIVPGDSAKVEVYARQMKQGVIFLDSPGGSLNEGLELGRTFRRNGIITVVLEKGACTSACALAWLGGVKRLLGSTASLGFHAAYVSSGSQTLVSSVGNARVGAYIVSLGFSDKVVDYVTTAQPQSMMWLNAADARRIGIPLEVRDFR